ncbi:MAG: DUF2264 domain-containing protein [Treponema sp.]|jgi:hypothetical protein|nr:DUF2264 domain-containing protein [Treponema sp.]
MTNTPERIGFDSPLRHNPFETRADLARSLVDLLEPLAAYAAPQGYHLGDFSALYPPKIARMEGWSRCLWGIGPYVAGGREWPRRDALLETLSRGVDPADSAYWGDCGSRDQRLVEMASISLCFMLAPQVFWSPLSEKTKQQCYRWLSFVEKNEVPGNNWHFFRLMVCSAFRSLGLPVNEAAEQASLKLMEACYRGEGWYADGENGAFDMYNPWGFHYYSLVLAALCGKAGASGPIPAYTERWLERARAFAQGFSHWFHHDGSMIPYGRSLSYRFAGSSFFSACAFAGLEALPWGQIKGIVLRNLRRWFSLPILDAGGILSVGYAYPNLVMADQYNSPGSPYWGLKTWLPLALGDEHPFWQAREEPLPEVPASMEKVPGFILSRTKDDTQLLNAGQHRQGDMNHGAQKYNKFAYSARFGFCVAHSNFNIDKTGCDSALLFSEGDGYWRERRGAPEAAAAGSRWVKSTWRPWPDVEVTTTLVRADGGWHLRIHQIQNGRPRALQTLEGGFSAPRVDDRGEAPPLPAPPLQAVYPETLLRFPWAASRIAALEGALDAAPGGAAALPPRAKAAFVVPAPNLNLLHPVVAIPTLERECPPGRSVFVTAVWAGDASGNAGGALPRLEAYAAYDAEKGLSVI